MSERTFWRITVPCVAGAVLATRWAFRSEFLFSWDSANYALAMDQIDIAAHRPHPPGYLAYVVVARAIDTTLHDVNASLVLWNVIATVLAALILLRFAWEIAEGARRQRVFTLGAGAVAISSPLLWFYGEVAEIYVSEMLVAVTLAFLAWQATRQRPRAIYWCALLFPAAAAFKATTAALLLPLLAYAWRGAPAGTRFRAVALLIIGSAIVGGAFLWAAPDLGRLTWRQFASSTSVSRLDLSKGRDALETLNHNFRDTLTAAIAMVGIVNLGALAFWIARDRRLPAGFGRTIAWLWAVPWLVLCLAVHIAKPGYLLPLLPLTALILAGFYARQRPVVGIALLIAQAVVNVAHFAALGSLSASMTGGSRLYRDKTLLQRFASDLQPLTLSTAATIRRSDLNVRRLIDAVRRRCPAGSPIIIAGIEPVDARRAMWYLPDATVVYTGERGVRGIARHGYLTPAPDESPPLTTDCQVFWLSGADSVPELPLPSTARLEPGVGFVIDARTIRVSSAAISFEAAGR